MLLIDYQLTIVLIIKVYIYNKFFIYILYIILFIDVAKLNLLKLKLS